MANKTTSCHLEDKYDFVPPSEAPVFTPTMEEFKDSMAYFEKIRPIGEQFGICKIKPPDEWKPPFAVDVDKLKFTPRIQRLNELEAHTRVKLNFLDQVAKFWELQGSSLKIPIVEKQALDLFTLRKYVQRNGGLEVVNEGNKWDKVAADIGYNPLHVARVGNKLKGHYERILYPLDVFENGRKKKLGDVETQINPAVKTSSGRMKDDSWVKAGKMSPGVKMKEKTVSHKDEDPLAKYLCQNCGNGGVEEQMLLCDGCDNSHHTFCLTPPLAEIPAGDWFCPNCVFTEVSKPMEAYGFQQAQKEYTLQSFGEMADRFKKDFFKTPSHLIPTGLVEREYWRILEDMEEDVMVEYGADLHSVDHGSGFPVLSNMNLTEEDRPYAVSEWNLNNLPVVPNSILKHIDMNISGMKVPWLYVGMCFSTFCWHVEDHWTPSINFLHWGEPKTWYGIPASFAEKAENVMCQSAPELFQAQPDLLHHIVTTMNPNVLQAHGVPVYRMDQHAGEFIITFSRAYHAGFNHGYNLAEAVNFAPPDWLQTMGRQCVEHYSAVRRFCVFCHDELVCKMAAHPEQLSTLLAATCFNDMMTMVQQEKAHRQALLEGGVRRAERKAFELLSEDERQCSVCNTTCFISALTTSDGKELVCLRHFPEMEADPSSLFLRYRYTLDELASMLQGLKTRAESSDTWSVRVREALQAKGEDRLELRALKEMLSEAKKGGYPESGLFETLQQAVEEAEKCEVVAQQLCRKNKRCTEDRSIIRYKFTVEELQLFYDQLKALPAKLAGCNEVGTLLAEVAQFQAKATSLLKADTVELEMVQRCLGEGEELDVEVVEVEQLRARADQLAWMKEVTELQANYKEVRISQQSQSEAKGNSLRILSPQSQVGLEALHWTVDSVQSLESASLLLEAHPAVDLGLSHLDGMRGDLKRWEEKVAGCLPIGDCESLQQLETQV